MKKAVRSREVRGRLGWPATAAVAALILALAESSSALQAGDFTYDRVSDGTAVRITGYSGPGGLLEIPSRIEDLPVIAIGDSAFADRADLTGALTLPASVTTIGEGAFNACSNLTSLALGSGVTEIGSYAFRYCRNLGGVLTLPDSVADIGGYAFCDCGALSGLSLGSGVTNISYFAFAYCRNLTGTLVIPDSVESIGSAAFHECSSLTGVNFGSGLRILGEWSFAYCYKLTGTVSIPDGVANIEKRTFYLCNNLTGVTLGNSVTSINEYAFFSCAKLKGAVVFPEGVAKVGDYAFDACPGIGGLYFKGQVPSVGFDALHNVTSAVYYVSGRAGWGLTFGGRPAEVWASTATFDAGTGSVTPGAQAYLVGHSYSSLPTPVHAHDVFGGWWTGAGGTGTQVVAGSLVPYVTAGHTLFAKWVPPSSEVTFDAQGGVSPNPSGKTVIYGEPYGALPQLSRLGYAFGGWLTAAGGAGTPVLPETEVTATAGHTLYAAWTYDPNAPQGALVGTALGMPLPDTFAAAARVAVKGLPTGLKYNAATKAVWGVPAKAGVFNVTISAAGADTLSFTFNVEALPVWAQGVFSGYTAGGGVASLSVSARGRATSGKLTYMGTSTTFNASSYAAGGNPATGFVLSTEARAGKLRLPIEVTVTPAPAPSPQSLGRAAATSGHNTLAYFWRGVWKEESARLAPFIGYYTATLAGSAEYGSGYLTLTVDKAGKVKAGGKLADGTAVSLSGTLILDNAGRVFAAIYTSPAAYKGGSLFGLAEFIDPDTAEVCLRPLDNVPFVWQSRSPQATPVYGAGFVRSPDLAGGWYSKTADLGAYYADKELAVGADADAPVPGLTVGAARYDSVWWSPSGIALTPTFKSGALAGLAAPAVGKPADADKDGVWDYSAANTVGLKVSLARPTGVVKGSFLAWFDYPVRKHASKRVAFEGVLTPVREDVGDGVEGRGYFLWPDKAVPPAPAKPYSFKGSYDFLLLGE